MQTINLPASIDQLGKINALLEETLSKDLEHMLFKTQLIVEELLANISSYAYEGALGKVSFACGEVNFDGKRAIYIQLTDQGLPYDPFLNYTEPDLNATIEERKIGGLGIHFIKEIASHYAYCRIDDCNQTQIFLEVDE